MTQFEKNVLEGIQELKVGVAKIETKLDNDYKTLHGHEGQKGLIQKHEELDDRVLTIETTYKTWGRVLAVFVAISTIISAIVAFLSYNNQIKEQKHESTRCQSEPR